MISDTIAAISTAVGEAGIAVIRVSGPQSIERNLAPSVPLFRIPQNHHEGDTYQ